MRLGEGGNVRSGRMWRAGARLPLLALLLIGSTLLAGCGQKYVLLHPVGTVGLEELHLMYLAAIAMGVVIVFVFALLAVTVYRFRDRPDRRAPFLPHFHGDRRLEVTWFVVPALILAVISVPMVRLTYTLAKMPDPAKGGDPLVIDVTSLSWKWLFEYPAQHVATVNYFEMPSGQPVLFELAADSAMNTFWVPQLGGMEYTMPGRLLPLWLTAPKPGTYWGHSGQFSGLEFEKMFFSDKVVTPTQFSQWAAHLRQTGKPMTMATYRQLLVHNTVGTMSFSSYPASTFPQVSHGFSLEGGMYTISQQGLSATPMSTGASQGGAGGGMTTGSGGG